MTLGKIEATLDEAFNKKAPVQIPSKSRTALADALWIVALVLGVVQLLATYSLWEAGHKTDTLVEYANDLSIAYGGPAISDGLGFLYYLSVLGLGVVAFLLLLAAPGLKAMRKDGWNLLFYSLLVQVVVAIVLLFADYGGFADFLGASLAALLGGYLLFQVRDSFVKHTHAAKKGASEE